MVIAEHLEVRQNYSAFASYFLLSSRCLEMFVFVIIDRFHCHAIKKLIENYPVDKVKKL